MIKLQYYSHLMLNSKYSFLIKLVIIFSIYTLFYLDSSADIAYCTKSKAVNLKKQNTELQHEIFALKNELTRFRMSVDPNSYREIDTLETLKERIASYRERHAAGFLTAEEQERPTYIRHTGAHRPDFRLGPEFFTPSTYIDVTNRFINPHRAEGLHVDEVFIEETGKEIIDLHKNFRWNKAYIGDYSQFKETNSWFFYDYTERYKEIYYPANHPDNNFDPNYKRLRKVVEREFFAKQLPDNFEDNCNIS